MWPGAAGHVSDAEALDRFALWLPAVPWLLAAALSLLLASTWRGMPRRLLLAAGWSATAVVATVGPAASWSLVTTLVGGADSASEGIALWVFALFYGSWLLWAVAAGAATRSYQLRSAAMWMSSPA
jgi:MFS transporter, DHA1 family, inner membrane transport protein